MFSAARRRAPLLLICGVCATTVVGGCRREPAPPSSATPFISQVTLAALDSLPIFAVEDGALLCLADGVAACPTSAATANWLGPDQFATWSSGLSIQRWVAGSTDPHPLGDLGTGENQYSRVLSVGTTPGGFAVIDGRGPRVLTYDHEGNFESALPIPALSATHAIGYSGRIAVAQLIHGAAADSPAVFEVRMLDTPGDTVGRSVLSVVIPWLVLDNGRPARPLPLFPVLPSFAFTSDSSIVWSAGDSFAVERRAPGGTIRWAITSDVRGPAVTGSEMAALRAKIAPHDTAAMRQFDSSAAHSPDHRAAIGGIMVAPDNGVLVAAAPAPGRDSVTYYAVTDLGRLRGRFSLPLRTRVVLFAGDSVVVQRAGANGDAELRWLRLNSGK